MVVLEVMSTLRLSFRKAFLKCTGCNVRIFAAYTDHLIISQELPGAIFCFVLLLPLGFAMTNCVHNYSTWRGKRKKWKTKLAWIQANKLSLASLKWGQH